MSRPLSPAAQAVVDAATLAYLRSPGVTLEPAIAAALRAAADAVVPEEPEPPVGEREPWPPAYQQMSDAKWEQRQATRALLLAEAQRAEEGADARRTTLSAYVD